VYIDPGASMAVQVDHGSERWAHRCQLPWPANPNLSEGHVCECGRRWSYQPAHWEPLYTIEELRDMQVDGDYHRGTL